MPSRRVMLIALTATAVVAAALWIPWATKARTVIASTPVPPPLNNYTPAPLKGGQTGCMQTVTFSPATQVGEIALVTRGAAGRGPQLDITAKAPGYRAATEIGAGWVTDDTVRFNLATPLKPVIGDLCIHNTGKQTIVLNSTTEFRTMGRPQLVIAGQVQPADPKLIFYRRGKASYLSRTGEILRHAATFTAPLFSRWVLGLLALAALIGMPLAIAFALRGAFDADSETD